MLTIEGLTRPLLPPAFQQVYQCSGIYCISCSSKKAAKAANMAQELRCLSHLPLVWGMSRQEGGFSPVGCDTGRAFSCL
jgi:hypothetical protein